MSNWWLGVFCLFFMINHKKCLSQNSKSCGNQQWLQYYNQYVISKKYTLFSDAGIRTANNGSRWSQWLIRTSLGYPITKKLNGASGIAVFYHFANKSNDVLEFRPFQELNTDHTFSITKIQHRFRTEARLYSQMGNEISNNQQQFDLRLRYRLMCIIPVLTTKTQKYSINVGNEFFYSYRLVSANTPIVGNRVLLGVSWKTCNNITWSLIYNAQRSRRMNPDFTESTDIIWVSLTHIVTSKKFK